ncbi:MAG: hypothetical protein UR69_C0004G0026 [Candidatus Moranbacteria bacterium GW2011_GWE2_35_2-]|nr:MAG: hypothetical protein UR69_C0004G0026 [Candidatus Moranbacteria bacterium GW2011_GWE2_35_2-]KKQ06359.1 MAG: hypothetical protein US15_C0013G0024 [Candidatus Moranbacteria bacterium GW2011_GWF1_36_4]KKQ22200.1 MAG: hypothetical protein US37_C0003G0026 [Candidatus Moranbacteria bacterium GW2011_GWF2_37_11]KKQ28744.1 MAG: hypothetical protein US44_C0007G0030 [Candidatus Moranbacteria bacterium GW2011_GWD1_37_17]KKQ30308.1 MAG: hypothetical protein US47_C0003G0103 [Candidatus Moranbacteria b
MPVNMNFVSGPEYGAQGKENNSNHQKLQEERMQKRADEMIESGHELAEEIREIMSGSERGFVGLNEEEIKKLAESGYDRKLIEIISAKIGDRITQ